MALKIIVSYDDTDNDRDALALGRLLAFSGAELSLAYVRHSQGGALEEKEAEELLARGAESVGAPDMPRHVVVNAGTSVGLTELAERESADVIVFGSEYRTAPGTVKPGISAHKLLLGGPAAIAVAPAGLRSQPVGQRQHRRHHRRGRRRPPRQTADSLAAALGATRRRARQRPGRPARRRLAARRRPPGKVTLSAASDYAVEAASYPVLVVPRGAALSFDGAARRRRGRPASSPADHEDHGRDRRVAAVDPLPRLGPLDRLAAAARGQLRRCGTRRSRPRRRRSVGSGAADLRRLEHSAGSRPRPSAAAFDQPWPKARSGPSRVRPLEDRQLALARFPLLFAELEGLAGEPRLEDLLQLGLAEVEDAGVVAGAI